METKNTLENCFIHIGSDGQFKCELCSRSYCIECKEQSDQPEFCLQCCLKLSERGYSDKPSRAKSGFSIVLKEKLKSAKDEIKNTDWSDIFSSLSVWLFIVVLISNIVDGAVPDWDGDLYNEISGRGGFAKLGGGLLYNLLNFSLFDIWIMVFVCTSLFLLRKNTIS